MLRHSGGPASTQLEQSVLHLRASDGPASCGRQQGSRREPRVAQLPDTFQEWHLSPASSPMLRARPQSILHCELWATAMVTARADSGCFRNNSAYLESATRSYKTIGLAITSTATRKSSQREFLRSARSLGRDSCQVECSPSHHCLSGLCMRLPKPQHNSKNNTTLSCQRLTHNSTLDFPISDTPTANRHPRSDIDNSAENWSHKKK